MIAHEYSSLLENQRNTWKKSKEDVHHHYPFYQYQSTSLGLIYIITLCCSTTDVTEQHRSSSASH